MVQERKKGESTLPLFSSNLDSPLQDSQVGQHLAGIHSAFHIYKTTQIQLLTFSSQMETEWKKDYSSVFSHSLYTK